MGGDCLNHQVCVPSKALIRAAHTAADINHAARLGIDAQINSIDFSKVMARIQHVIQKIEPHDSIERYSKLGVNCITGDAKILSPWES